MSRLTYAQLVVLAATTAGAVVNGYVLDLRLWLGEPPDRGGIGHGPGTVSGL